MSRGDKGDKGDKGDMGNGRTLTKNRKRLGIKLSRELSGDNR